VLEEVLHLCTKHGFYMCWEVLQSFVGNVFTLLKFVRNMLTHGTRCKTSFCSAVNNSYKCRNHSYTCRNNSYICKNYSYTLHHMLESFLQYSALWEYLFIYVQKLKYLTLCYKSMLNILSLFKLSNSFLNSSIDAASAILLGSEFQLFTTWWEK